MIRPLVLRRQARIEFDQAADWYEARRPGLGARFAADVQEVFDSAAANPRRHPVVLGDVHEGLVRGFPYCVYYREENEQILILAIFDTSRDSSIWQSRV